jgi:hypothetical protein
MGLCRSAAQALVVFAVAACAKPLPAPELGLVPAALQAHPAFGAWRLQVERQDTSIGQPDVLPTEATLTLTAEPRSRVGQPLYLRANLQPPRGHPRAFAWIPVPGTDSIEVVTMNGIELRLLVATERLDGRVNLICDLGLECRLPYGLAHASRTGPAGR